MARADRPATMIAAERMVIFGEYRGYALGIGVCLIPDQRLLELFSCEYKDCCVGSSLLVG